MVIFHTVSTRDSYGKGSNPRTDIKYRKSIKRPAVHINIPKINTSVTKWTHLNAPWGADLRGVGSTYSNERSDTSRQCKAPVIPWEICGFKLETDIKLKVLQIQDWNLNMDKNDIMIVVHIHV